MAVPGRRRRLLPHRQPEQRQVPRRRQRLHRRRRQHHPVHLRQRHQPAVAVGRHRQLLPAQGPPQRQVPRRGQRRHRRRRRHPAVHLRHRHQPAVDPVHRVSAARPCLGRWAVWLFLGKAVMRRLMAEGCPVYLFDADSIVVSTANELLRTHRPVSGWTTSPAPAAGQPAPCGRRDERPPDPGGGRASRGSRQPDF